MIDSIHVLQLENYKDAMGFLSIAIMVAAYGIYLRQTYRRQVLPHPLSWLLFGSSTLVGFFVQVSKGADAGSWVMGLTSFICFLLFGFSWYKGRRLTYSAGDWKFFGGALLVLVFYVGTVYVFKLDPTLSAIVATVADVLGYGPTIKKGWRLPYGDSFTSYFLNSAKFIPSLFALGSYSVATYLLPGTLVIVNAAVAFLLVWRRHRMKIAKSGS